MNREIKFRAWDLDRKVMITDAVKLEQHIIFHRAMLEKAENVEWMQYTGLKDRNGNDIYEGDIIKINHPFKGRTYTGKVVFIDGCFYGEGFYFSHYDIPNNCFSEGLEYIEVIGNIFQNPELLSND